MSDSERPHVLAARQVQSVEFIDGGDTLAVRLRIADGGDTCLLLPIGAVGDLLSQLAAAIHVGPDRASRTAG